MIAVEVAASISNLQRSLCELWEAAEDSCDCLTLTRALTQNLIVVTDADRIPETHELIDGLLARHPCRAVVVGIRAADCDLAGQLSGRVQEHGRGRAMVLERLTILTDWKHYPKLPNLIRPLLVNDIPTSVFWATSLPDSLGRISALAAMADHTIVDSTLFDGDDWRSLAQLAEHAPFDLAWLRLAPWRRSLAEAFEHFEWQPEDPPTDVVIEHGPTFGSVGASRGLEHWLVAKLEAKVRLVELSGDGRGDEPGPTGEPWRVDLTHGDIHIRIRHLLAEPRLEIMVTLLDHCLLPTYAQATRGDRSALLAAALDIAS